MGFGPSHRNGRSGPELIWKLFPAKQGRTGHGGRFGQSQHLKECGGNVRKNTICHLELIRIGSYVEAVNKIGGVGGMG